MDFGFDIVVRMDQGAGQTRNDFRALGSFRGDAAGLFAASSGRDYDIELWDWIAAASPHPDSELDDQVEQWAAAWIFASRWAGTVARRPAFIAHAQRAGIGPLLEAVHAQIVSVAMSWNWPVEAAIGDAETADLEWTYVLLSAAEHGYGPVRTWVGLDDEHPIRRTLPDSWRTVLRLELRDRGRLPRVVREVADYDGAARVTIAPTQLAVDEGGRSIPRSRMVRVLDEWCELLSAGPTNIQALEIATRSPKRLVSALHGQTQLRAMDITWGDYDDIRAVALMPALWNLRLGGASALTDLDPLRSAASLRVLILTQTRRLVDFSPISELAGLEELELFPGTNGKVGTIPDLEFLRALPHLKRLHLGARVLSRDYSPLLEHRGVDSMWVLKQRNMTPSFSELEEEIPGLRASW